MENKEVDKIISWWINLPKDYSDISMLLYMQQKLSGYSYYLACDSADFKKDYNFAYFWRKINVNKRKNAFIETGMSASASESLAIEKTEDELRKEIEAETVVYKQDLILKQIGNILNSLTQRISYLKAEYDKTRFENNLKQ